jgi:flagellar biosynthesis/type III secretory pathway chaperone
MKLFDSELQYLSELYSRLGAEFASLKKGSSPGKPSTIVDFALRNKELFARLEQVNARLHQLVKEWERFSPHLDPSAKKQAQQLISGVRKQALELSRLNQQRLAELEAFRAGLVGELEKLQRGNRYLDSVKPLKANFPKFLDSRG